MVIVEIYILSCTFALVTYFYTHAVANDPTLKALPFRQSKDIAGGELVPHVPRTRSTEVCFSVDLGGGPAWNARHDIIVGRAAVFEDAVEYTRRSRYHVSAVWP